MTNDTTSLFSPRRPLIAAILSLVLPPLGHVYVGRMLRGILLWILGHGITAASYFALVTLAIGRYGLMLLIVLPLVYAFWLAFDAFRLGRANYPQQRKSYQRWWTYLLVPLATIATTTTVHDIVRASVAESFIISSRSMAPTMQQGDRIVTDKLRCNADHLSRGDLIVFHSEGPGTELYIHRLIGRPGELVEVKNEQVYVDANRIDDPCAFHDPQLKPDRRLSDWGPIRLDSHSLFVMGDNRRRARDSRILGPVPISDLHAVARVIYWSRDANGAIRWERIGKRLD